MEGKDMNDLDKLIAAVEGGTATEFQFLTWRPGFTGTRKESATMQRAYHGSIDAAKALHEALLPEWKWGVVDHADGDFGAGVGLKEVDEMIGVSTNASRSWLIAILKAHRHNLANGAAQ